VANAGEVLDETNRHSFYILTSPQFTSARIISDTQQRETSSSGKEKPPSEKGRVVRSL
jgi:hypothetical protein